jgi:hypothetical protein
MLIMLRMNITIIFFREALANSEYCQDLVEESSTGTIAVMWLGLIGAIITTT